MDIRVLKEDNFDEVLEFARQQFAGQDLDPLELELKSWSARWRPEELRHYLSVGWSFGAWENSSLSGFILTQPLLFCRGFTQTLWVEWISYKNLESGQQLLESAYRWARDKHFQTVLISECPKDLQSVLPSQQLRDVIVEVASSRWTGA